jgi:predicted adenine nucleotide alpha hydrolase (AANH) superfamily ATPase
MRSLLVSLEKPEYNFGVSSVQDLELDHPPSIFGKTYCGCVWSDLRAEYRRLNEGQKEAVRKVLAAKDYVLLLGMPGTG